MNNSGDHGQDKPVLNKDVADGIGQLRGDLEGSGIYTSTTHTGSSNVGHDFLANTNISGSVSLEAIQAQTLKEEKQRLQNPSALTSELEQHVSGMEVQFNMGYEKDKTLIQTHFTQLKGLMVENKGLLREKCAGAVKDMYSRLTQKLENLETVGGLDDSMNGGYMISKEDVTELQELFTEISEYAPAVTQTTTNISVSEPTTNASPKEPEKKPAVTPVSTHTATETATITTTLTPVIPASIQPVIDNPSSITSTASTSTSSSIKDRLAKFNAQPNPEETQRKPQAQVRKIQNNSFVIGQADNNSAPQLSKPINIGTTKGAFKDLQAKLAATGAMPGGAPSLAKGVQLTPQQEKERRTLTTRAGHLKDKNILQQIEKLHTPDGAALTFDSLMAVIEEQEQKEAQPAPAVTVASPPVASMSTPAVLVGSIPSAPPPPPAAPLPPPTGGATKGGWRENYRPSTDTPAPTSTQEEAKYDAKAEANKQKLEQQKEAAKGIGDMVLQKQQQMKEKGDAQAKVDPMAAKQKAAEEEKKRKEEEQRQKDEENARRAAEVQKRIDEQKRAHEERKRRQEEEKQKAETTQPLTRRRKGAGTALPVRNMQQEAGMNQLDNLPEKKDNLRQENNDNPGLDAYQPELPEVSKEVKNMKPNKQDVQSDDNDKKKKKSDDSSKRTKEESSVEKGKKNKDKKDKKKDKKEEKETPTKGDGEKADEGKMQGEQQKSEDVDKKKQLKLKQLSKLFTSGKSSQKKGVAGTPTEEVASDDKNEGKGGAGEQDTSTKKSKVGFKNPLKKKNKDTEGAEVTEEEVTHEDKQKQEKQSASSSEVESSNDKEKEEKKSEEKETPSPKRIIVKKNSSVGKGSTGSPDAQFTEGEGSFKGQLKLKRLERQTSKSQNVLDTQLISPRSLHLLNTDTASLVNTTLASPTSTAFRRSTTSLEMHSLEGEENVEGSKQLKQLVRRPSRRHDVTNPNDAQSSPSPLSSPRSPSAGRLSVASTFNTSPMPISSDKAVSRRSAASPDTQLTDEKARKQEEVKQLVLVKGSDRKSTEVSQEISSPSTNSPAALSPSNLQATPTSTTSRTVSRRSRILPDAQSPEDEEKNKKVRQGLIVKRANRDGLASGPSSQSGGTSVADSTSNVSSTKTVSPTVHSHSDNTGANLLINRWQDKNNKEREIKQLEKMEQQLYNWSRASDVQNLDITAAVEEIVEGTSNTGPKVSATTNTAALAGASTSNTSSNNVATPEVQVETSNTKSVNIASNTTNVLQPTSAVDNITTSVFPTMEQSSTVQSDATKLARRNSASASSVYTQKDKNRLVDTGKQVLQDTREKWNKRASGGENKMNNKGNAPVPGTGDQDMQVSTTTTTTLDSVKAGGTPPATPEKKTPVVLPDLTSNIEVVDITTASSVSTPTSTPPAPTPAPVVKLAFSPTTGQDNTQPDAQADAEKEREARKAAVEKEKQEIVEQNALKEQKERQEENQRKLDEDIKAGKQLQMELLEELDKKVQQTPKERPKLETDIMLVRNKVLEFDNKEGHIFTEELKAKFQEEVLKLQTEDRRRQGEETRSQEEERKRQEEERLRLETEERKRQEEERQERINTAVEKGRMEQQEMLGRLDQRIGELLDNNPLHGELTTLREELVNFKNKADNLFTGAKDGFQQKITAAEEQEKARVRQVEEERKRQEEERKRQEEENQAQIKAAVERGEQERQEMIMGLDTRIAELDSTDYLHGQLIAIKERIASFDNKADQLFTDFRADFQRGIDGAEKKQIVLEQGRKEESERLEKERLRQKEEENLRKQEEENRKKEEENRRKEEEKRQAQLQAALEQGKQEKAKMLEEIDGLRSGLDSTSGLYRRLGSLRVEIASFINEAGHLFNDVKDGFKQRISIEAGHKAEEDRQYQENEKAVNRERKRRLQDQLAFLLEQKLWQPDDAKRNTAYTNLRNLQAEVQEMEGDKFSAQVRQNLNTNVMPAGWKSDNHMRQDGLLAKIDRMLSQRSWPGDRTGLNNIRGQIAGDANKNQCNDGFVAQKTLEIERWVVSTGYKTDAQMQQLPQQPPQAQPDPQAQQQAAAQQAAEQEKAANRDRKAALTVECNYILAATFWADQGRRDTAYAPIRELLQRIGAIADDDFTVAAQNGLNAPNPLIPAGWKSDADVQRDWKQGLLNEITAITSQTVWNLDDVERAGKYAALNTLRTEINGIQENTLTAAKVQEYRGRIVAPDGWMSDVGAQQAWKPYLLRKITQITSQTLWQRGRTATQCTNDYAALNTLRGEISAAQENTFTIVQIRSYQNRTTNGKPAGWLDDNAVRKRDLLAWIDSMLRNTRWLPQTHHGDWFAGLRTIRETIEATAEAKFTTSFRWDQDKIINNWIKTNGWRADDVVMAEIKSAAERAAHRRQSQAITAVRQREHAVYTAVAATEGAIGVGIWFVAGSNPADMVGFIMKANSALGHPVITILLTTLGSLGVGGGVGALTYLANKPSVALGHIDRHDRKLKQQKAEAEQPNGWILAPMVAMPVFNTLVTTVIATQPALYLKMLQAAADAGISQYAMGGLLTIIPALLTVVPLAIGNAQER